MKHSLTIFFSFHLFISTAVLPLGDLSAIACIPQWYAHCKATEDADMGPIDFITDHLLDFDRVTDAHGDGDHQRPHLPFQLPSMLLSFDLGALPVSAPIVTDAVPFIAVPQPLLYHCTLPEAIFHPPLHG